MSQSDLPDFSGFAVGGDDFAAPDFSSGAIAPESPALPMLPIPQKYIDGIKGFEGFTPKAKWDYKQHTNGFGTRAQPGEEIDEETANVRLHEEIGKAANIVDKFAPGLPSGVRAALTSLTFNAGDKWTRMGLGAAIRDGDMEEAGRRFNQYVKAGDETLPGLVNRRAKEYEWWFDEDGDGKNDAPESSALADLLQAPPEKRRDILLSEMERISGADLSAQRVAAAPKEPAALDFSSFAVTPAAPKDGGEKPLGIVEELSRALERGTTSFGQQAYGHKAMNTIEEIKRIQSVEDRIAKGDKNFTDERDIGYAALLPAERQKLIQNYTASLEDALKGVAERGPKIAAIPPSPDIEKALNAKSFGEFWNTFKKSPLRFIATVGTESLPQMAPGLAGAIPGGMIAGPAGAAGALGAGSFLTDFSNQIISGLADEGVDTKDPAALEKAFKDPALMSKLKERAGLHAAAVGAFDAISGGVASKTLLPAKTLAKKPIAREAANIAVQLPVQGTLGAAGEVAGSVASGQEVQPGQVGAEFFGEFIGAPAEVAGIRSAAAAQKAEEAAKPEPQKLLTETKKLPPPSTGTPPPVPRQPAAVAPDDSALLKQRGWSDADIAEMGEEERADAIAEARDQVGKDAARAPDTPSAEPVSDLAAQIEAMRAGERKGVYLSPDNLANIQSNPDFVARISEALNRSKGAEIVENVDGKGGILVAGSPEIAKKVKKSIKSGADTQAVLGDVTGAGKGKPADTAAVVQQKTPDGAVVRESAVSAADVAKTEQEFAAPGKTVETVTPEQAIARRDEAIAAESTSGPTFEAQKGDGTRSAPVTIKSAEDVARAGAIVASEPTEKQAEAGNYQKAHIRFQGIPISIETPKGGTRRGVKDGVTQWEVPDMPAAYGYVRGSTGADGEQIDVFIGDNVDSDSVFVVDQIDAETGKFDEHKAVLGANSPSEAAELYANSFSDGRGMARIGGMSEMTVAEFKTWARDGVQKAPLDAEPVNFDAADFSDQATPRSRTIERPERPDRYEGEPLEPAEIDAIVDSWRYVQDVMRRGRPQSLAAFVIENGGLRDDAREVRHIAGSAKERPGLVNKNGVDLDDAALSAWESGFFAGSERPTIAEFLDALQDDLATGNVLRDADQPLLEDLRIAEDIAQEIADYGVTTNRFRSEASLREYFGQERPRAAAKTEGDEKAQAPAKGRAGEAGADLVGDTFDLPEKGKTDKAFDPFAFSVQVAYAKTGADGLRKKLADLSSDQLKQIVSAQNLPVSDDVIARGNKKPLVDAIIEAAKSKLANRAAAGGGTVEGITGAKPKALPEEVWGPKFQKLMSSEYRTAVAGEDLSTQYDILTAKYNNAPNDPADMRAAMKAEIERLERELGPEWMAKYGGKAEAKPEPKTDWDFEPNAGWRDHLIRARVYATGLGINHKGMELPEIVEAIDRKLSDHQGVPEGVTVRLSDYTLDEPEASQKGGQYKAIAERKSPWSVEDGYGSTPAEARANALQRLLKKVQPQTSLVPEATTKEKIAAEAKSKEKRGSNEPMDVGMFGSEKDQTDLVDMAKQEKPEPIPTEEDEGPDFSGKPEDVRAIVDFHTQRQGGAVEFLKKNVRADSTVGEINALLSSSRAWGPAMSVSWSGDVPGAFGSSNRSSVLEITIRKNGEPDRIELQGKELADHIKALYAPQAGEQSASGLDAIRDRLLGDGFEGIVEARKFAKENGVDGTNKEIDEAIETAVVAAARERIEQRQNNAAKVFEIYRSLVKLYDNQPNLAVRTSTSVTNQAYSTPMPLAYLASRLAGVRGADVVYEPTAGNGALLIEAGPTNDEVYANEIDPKRAEALKALGFTVSQDDAATSGEIEQKADAIVANPPFGAVRENGQSKTWTVDGLTTTAIDHAIALNALHSMTDDGKAVLILGGIKAESVEERRAGYRGQSKRKFFAKLYKTYNVVDHFTVSGELYKKQGAGWPVDVVVIEGRGASSRVLPAAEPPQIFTSWDELEGKLPDANAAPGYKKEAVGRRGQDDKTARGKPEPESRDGNRSEAPVQRGPERLPAGTKDDAVSVQRDSDRGKSGDVRPDSNNARPDASKRDRDSGRADKPAAPRREPVVRKEPPKGSGQALYLPTSAATSLDSLVPSNMAGATKTALNRVSAKHGDIDAFVQDRLAYDEDLGKYFSAEQVDALATAIDNVERGAAFIIGDQTGIGKGRFVAGMIRYAIRKGWTPVFVTEKPDLYGDMFRDMTDIGLPKMLGREPRAFMTNTGESVPLDDEALAWKQEADQARADGQPIPKRRGRFLTGGGKAAQESAMSAIVSGKSEHDIVFTTYDQMNTIKQQETDRRNFLRRVAPNAMLILDESHNAGGQGEKMFKTKGAPDRAEFVRGLVKEAAGVVYSSATFAKRPDVMDLYARTDMGKAVDDPKMLPALIQRGGVPMQQIVATMLSDAGQYMRRERSFEGVEYSVVPVPVDQKTYSQFSDAVRAVFEFDLAIEETRSEFMEDVLDQMGATQAKDAGVGGASANSIAFASIMHNIVNQMILSIKADQVATRAIEARKAGEKPVIALASTMESFISDYAEDAGIMLNAPIDITFGDVLKKYLDRTLRITVKSAENEKSHVQIPIKSLPTSLQKMFAEAKAAIDDGDFSAMPVSPIDWIRYRLGKAGISVAEVTGRKSMIDYGAGKTPKYIVRPKKEIGPSGKRSSIAAFNRGDLDALILNRSGSTGVSMHASSKFKDQSLRHMIIAQAEGNIDTHLQMLGRVHRTGQVKTPRYSQIAAEIPAEARPTAVLMKKMASLNANTTGARGSVFMADSVDFMNEYGDKVVANIIMDEPEINDRLGSPLKENDKGIPVNEDAARRVTGRLVLLSPQDQTDLLNRIQDEYKTEIDRLDALGENALEAKTVDLQARVLDTTPLKDKAGEGPFLDSAQIEKVSVKAQGRAMSPAEIVEELSEFLGVSKPEGNEQASLATLERQGREWINKKVGDVRSRAVSWIAEDVAGVKSDDARAATKIRHDEQLRRWLATAQASAPGSRVTLEMGERQLHGIVLSVARTGKAKNPVALGAWVVTVAVPDSARTIAFPMSKLYPASATKSDDETGATIKPSMVPTSGLISQLNDARREGREERYMVTGNILAGYDQVHGKGQIVNFTMEDGSLRPGILMSRDFALNKFMDTRTVRLRSADQVAEFLEKAPIAEVRTSDKFVTLRLNRGNWTIETAAGRATGGRYYTDSRVRDALRGAEFQRSSGVMRVDLDKAGFKRVVEAIRSLGALFETTEAQDIAQDVVRASAPADAAPAAQTVAKTKPQSDTSKKIAEFGKSVDALKDQLGITTKKLNLDDDIQYAISGNAIATLRDQVAAMKGGSRVQVISEHAASYVADADLIVGTLEDAEIDIFDASADDLKAYLVALADLGQVIQTKTQQGYALSEEVQGLRDLLSDRMREYSFKISELETDAEWLGGRLTERLEEIDARIEEIAGPQPEETPEEEKALFERYDAVKEETPVDAGEHSPEASQLDVVEDEVTFAVALITPMQTQVEEFEARDIEEMDVAQLNAFRGEVERLEWTAYRASAWYKTLGEIADTGETKVYDVIDAINDDQIVPASERLEEAADDVTTKIDDARERLIDQQEMDAGQVIELADGTEAGPTWVKERIASWSKAISGLKQSNEALRAKSGTGINEEWKAATIARQEEEIARLSKDLEIYREGLADYEASNAQPLAAISSNVDISERAGEDAPFIDTPFGDLLFALSAKAASMKAEGTAAQWINKNEKADINWKAAYKAGVPSIAHVPAKQFKEKSSDASIKTISENLDLADYLKRQEGNVQGALAPEVAQAVQMYRDDPRGATAFIHNHIAQQRVRLLNEWRRYLTEVNEDYAKDPFWLDYVWSGITGKLNKESPTLPPPLLAGAVADVYLDVKNEPSMSTFDKLYEEAAVDSAVAQSSDDSRVDVGEEKTWVKVPQTQPNHSDFAKNVGLVRALSCKTWCTSQGMAEHYLPQGDFWVLTEGGQTKMAVRFRGKEVAEIQGPANNGRIPVQHIADVQALVDSDSVKLGQTAKKELDAAIMRVATAKELQDKIAANDIIGAWQALGASATPVFDGLRISGLDLERRNSLIADIDPGLIVRLVTNVTELEGDYVAYQRSPDEIDLPNLRLVDGDLRVYGKDTGRIQEVTGAVDWFTGRGATELSRASGGSFMRNDVGGRTGHSVISYVDVDGERLVVKLEPSYHALDASIDFNKQPGYVRRALHDFAEREGTGPFHQGSLQFAFDEALEERPKKPTLLQEARLWVLERKLKKRARELERVAGRIGRKNWLYSHRTKIGTVGHALGRAFEAGGLGINADTASLAIKNNASWITHPFLIRKARKYEAAKRAVESYMATLETKADNAGRKVRNDARKKSSVFEVLKKAGVKAIAFNDGATAAIYDPSVLIVTSKDGKPVEGKLRQAAIAKLLRQDEEAAPSFAVSGRAADVTPLSYSELEDAVRAGETFVIPADRVSEQLKSIRPMLGIVSPDTHVGVLERVIPLPNDSIDPLKQKAKLRFATPDGKGLTLTFFLRQLDGMRAFAMPAALLGGRPGIFLLNVGAFEKLGPAAAGQIWHEGFHVLRGQGRITGDVWNRLLGHANKLRILDMPLKIVLRALGDLEPCPDVTLRKAYSQLYQNREDKVEVIRQEAITHMLELWHHGALSDADMTPVLDILADIGSGRVSDNPRALEYAQMAEPAYAINAYHGSPHQFDRFAMDRVGTGEGAAAYGKGLYFAENEGVAKNYQEAMKARPDEVQAYANTALHFSNGDKKQALAYARDRASKDIRGDRRARWADAVELLETGKASEYGGQLYSVTINADKEDMIGWDTQLKKQDPKIAKAVSEILGFDARTWNGREAYNEIGMKLGKSLDAANAALLKKGIVGIHYLDQVSRGAGEGTSNFVIFDDSLIEINAVNGKPVKPEVRAEVLESRRDGFNSAPLDMSTDGRRARAEAMGFDFDTPYYHGTGAVFDAFSREFLGKNFDYGGTENGFFFSDKKSFAEQYVKSGGRLIEARLKMSNPLVFNVSDSMRREVERVAAEKGKLAAIAHKMALNVVDKYALYEPEFTSIFDMAQKRGHDAVVVDFGKDSKFGRVVIIPDPTQIREAGAAFDPKETASPQLLAAISGPAVDDVWSKIKVLDAELSGPMGKAIDAWVGGPHDSIEMGLTGGLMIPSRLEKMSDSDLEAAAKPVREVLRAAYGDTITVYRGELKDAKQSTGRENRLMSYTTSRRVAEWFTGAQAKPKKVYSEEEIAAAEKQLAETGEAKLGRITYRQDPESKYVDMYDRADDFITDTPSLRYDVEGDNAEAIAQNAKRDELLKNVREVRIPVDAVVWATDRFRQQEIIAKAGNELPVVDEPAALDMSPQARKARAEAQGFDTSKVWYHGATRWEGPGKDGRPVGDFTTFDRMASVNSIGRKAGMDTVGSWFSDLPGSNGASMYAGQNGAVYPVYLAVNNPWEPASFDEFLDQFHRAAKRDPKKQNPRGLGSAEELRAWLKNKGYDGIKFPVGTVDGKDQTVIVALDSDQIRSVNAAFDPAENASNNILAAISGRTPVDRVMAWMEWAKDLKPKSLPEIKDRAGQSYSVDRRPFNGAITYTVRKGKKEVGSFYVRTGGSVLESVSVMNARVESNYQRRGIASAAYDAIEADLAPGGLSLYPQGSMSLSADGRAFWQSRDPGKLREMIEAERDPFRMYGQTIRPTIDANAQSDVTTAINDAIEIVQRIAGQGVQVEFRSAIPTSEILARATDQSAEARARGMVGESSGGFYRRKTLHAEALIGLSTNAPGFDLKTSAGHESWHHVESVLATDAEYRLLTSESEMSRMRPLAAKELGIDVEDAVLRAMPDYEVRAYAFQRYRKLREDNITAPGLHIGVRRFFDRLIQVFRNVQNALRGQDYDSFESIFARARSGEMAQRAGTSAQPSQIELMVRKAVADVANSNRDTQHHVGAFIRQWLVQSSGDSITATDAYDTYTEWAEAAGIEPATVPEFSRGMSADRISSMKIAGAKRYIGLRVAEESERKAANPDEVFEKDAFEIARDVALGFSVRQSAERQIERLKSVVGEKPEFGRIANLEGMLAGMANDNAIDQQVYDNVLPMFDVMGNVIPENRPTPANRSGSVLGRRIRRTIARASDLSDRARVSLQDRALPIRRLAVERVENETGASVPVSLDTYVAEALYHGRAGERMNDLQDDIIEPLIEHLRQADITAEALGDYLYARHARERNAAILAIDPANDAGSGMTDQEADATLAAVRASGKHADMETAAGMVDRIIEDARKTLLKAGLIDRETFDTWSQKYAHYVPLRGFELGEDENPARIRSGRGFDIRGPESMQALGRRSKADNPVMYAVLQAQQAIVRAEKNRVNKTLYRMIQSNPNPAVWKIYRGEMRSRINPTTGFVEQYWVLPPFVRNDAVHGVKINGKQLWMELRHPALARAMRGVGSEIQGTVIGRALMGLTRTYASLLTSYNPEFMVSNFFRDVETAVFNSLDIEGGSKGVRAQIVKDALALKSIRGAFNALRGNAEGDYARFFDEYRLAGGKISFMEFNDVERIKKRINASLKAGKMRRALTAAARYVEDINSAVENGVRLSTYIAMRKNGVEKDRAAFTARELTVNFNRKGEWGPGINAAYLFFNASVQGTTRVVQAFARSKAVRYAVGSVFATGMALELFNFLMSGDDDDGENKYDKIPEWVRDRNIIIMNPFGSGDYIMIPMAYGYNLPYLAGQEMMRMGRGKSSPLEGAGRIAGATIDAFNPMGTNPLGAAGSFWQFVAPTMLDPGVQVLENRTWYGGPIQPTKYDQRKPDSENYFTSAPWWAVDTAKILNSMSGGNPARPGYVDVSPEVIEHYVEFAGGGVAKFVMNALNSGERLINGEEWLPEKAPFVRRLYGKSTSESRKREFFEAWDDVDRAQYEVKKLTKDGDRDAAQAAREKYAPELKVFGQMNAAKKTLKALREQHDKIEANTDLGRDEREARLNEIRDREKALIMRVLKSYRDAQKPAKPE